MNRIIEVTVSPLGETVVATQGYQGLDCFWATQFLEKALGTVTHDKKTEAFYQTSGAEQHLYQ